MGTIAKLSLAGTLVLLAACGSSEPSRVEGGAPAGVATGATIGLVGGGGGAIAGATTSPREVNLGDPVWGKDS